MNDQTYLLVVNDRRKRRSIPRDPNADPLPLRSPMNSESDEPPTCICEGGNKIDGATLVRWLPDQKKMVPFGRHERQWHLAAFIFQTRKLAAGINEQASNGMDSLRQLLLRQNSQRWPFLMWTNAIYWVIHEFLHFSDSAMFFNSKFNKFWTVRKILKSCTLLVVCPWRSGEALDGKPITELRAIYWPLSVYCDFRPSACSDRIQGKRLSIDLSKTYRTMCIYINFARISHPFLYKNECWLREKWQLDATFQFFHRSHWWNCRCRWKCQFDGSIPDSVCGTRAEREGMYVHFFQLQIRRCQFVPKNEKQHFSLNSTAGSHLDTSTDPTATIRCLKLHARRSKFNFGTFLSKKMWKH